MARDDGASFAAQLVSHPSEQTLCCRLRLQDLGLAEALEALSLHGDIVPFADEVPIYTLLKQSSVTIAGQLEVPELGPRPRVQLCHAVCSAVSAVALQR